MNNKRKANRFIYFSIIGVFIIISLIILNLVVGMGNIGFYDVLKTITSYEGTKEQLIITTIRLPRALLAILVGGAFGVGGLVMQGVTRNPLASPQVLGINSGAALAVVTCIVFFPGIPSIYHVIFAFCGAIFSGIFVYGVGVMRGLSPIKLTLGGLAMHLFLRSFSQGFILLNEGSTEMLLFWLSGSLNKAQWVDIKTLAPWIVIGLILALYISEGIEALQLGDKVAVSLGQNINKVRFLGAFTVIILAGASVSVVGPIAFVGLITPHLIKSVSSSYIHKVILAFIYGGSLLLFSDIISHYLRYPFESPVGIVTSFMGAIFYIILAKKQLRRKV